MLILLLQYLGDVVILLSHGNMEKTFVQVRILREESEDPLLTGIIGALNQPNLGPTSSTSSTGKRVTVISNFGRHVCEASENSQIILGQETLNDLQWYFEEYPLKEPFAKQRAEFARRKLRQHGSSLLQDFIPKEILTVQCHLLDILIEIQDTGSGNAPTQKHFVDLAFWELLEDAELWQESLGLLPRSIHVVRSHPSNRLQGQEGVEARQTCELPTNPNQRHHILAITARPLDIKDIPHRLITRTIASAVRSVPQSSRDTPTISIVRPGTLAALQENLGMHPPGYFDILHLDLHGDISDGR